jgi:spermidine dehydrogenase
MTMSEEFSKLGMGRAITRRNFLNGVAVGVTGAYLASHEPYLIADQSTSAEPVSSDYPPLRSGLRGNYPAAVEEFQPIRNGEFSDFPVPENEIHEEYDLVIVGAGISGLSAAHFYRTALGKDQRILVLDNHDDFGGHAKRNEFHFQGKTYLGYGGTMSIATPFPYSYAAKSLIKELGIEVDKYPQFVNHDLETKYGMGSGMFFDKEHFGEDRLLLGYGRLPWAEWFSKAPLTDAARNDLVRLHGKNPDYMSGLSEDEKKARLAKMSYKDYLLNVAKMTQDALPVFLGQGARNNKRVDTLPALEAAKHGAVGFNGLGLRLGEQFNEGSYYFHFPDGNASVARLLISRLVPSAVSGDQSMNTIVGANFAYDRLDEDGSKIRIRLSSPVVRVQHEGSPETADRVRVAYMRNGKLVAVRTRFCILACYNSLIPGLIPEIPTRQKDALNYPVKVPMLYTNVLIRRWTAFQQLSVNSCQVPGMYYTNVFLDPGTTIGGYQGAATPEEPILVKMIRNPNKPGLPRKEQNRAGQQELLSMTFEQFELETRRQLARMAGRGGFDPAEDIVAITVNRWPFGYAYSYDTLADPDVPPEERPHIIGRQRFGCVTIANSDAGAAAFTNQAIDEANRAVEELLVYQGLT